MRPEKIYKYQPINNYSLANLKNNQVWFSSTKDFNDPFECSFAYGNAGLKFTEGVHNTDIHLNQKGVTCFSEICDNALMWSYYGDKHRGFCLEFSTNHDLFENLYKVKYLDTIPLIYQDNLEAENVLKEWMFIKSCNWAHEKEWRLLNERCNFGLGFRKESLTGIYFGVKMEPVNKDIVKLIADSSCPKAILYEGYLKESSYSIDFKKI